MDIQVFGQNELVNRISDHKTTYSHCISIIKSSETTPVEITSHFTSLLSLKFSDVALDEPDAPQKAHVEQVIRYYNETKHVATGYTVHCYNGISRSAAIALGLLYLVHGNETQAIRELMKINHKVNPHRGILKFYDEILGSHLATSEHLIADARLEAMRTYLQDRVSV